ncbi:MAG: YbjN domain-containing protein [Pseudomonadota bacterium]
MSTELWDAAQSDADPLDALETVAGALELDSERVDDGELHLALPGLWRDAGLWFTWRAELSTMQLGAPLDLKAPSDRHGDICRLAALVNERLWIGHFDVWSEDSSIVYRNAIVLPEDGALDAAQAQILIRGAKEAIDRFFPAFNYVIWGGRKPEDAIEASLFETVGTA